MPSSTKTLEPESSSVWFLYVHTQLLPPPPLTIPLLMLFFLALTTVILGFGDRDPFLPVPGSAPYSQVSLYGHEDSQIFMFTIIIRGVC